MLADEEDEKRKRSLSTDDAGLLASLSSFSVKARREFSSLMSSISGSDGIWREFTKDLERDWPDFMARVGYPPVPVSVVSFFVKSDTPEVSDSDRRMVREALEFAVSAGGGFPVYQVLIASRDTYTRIGQEWMKRGFWAWANYKWLSFADTFRDGLYGPTAAATNEEGLTQWAGVLVFDSMDELVSSFSQPVSTLAPLVVGGKSLDIQTILDRLVESPKAAQPGHWTNYRVPELIRVAAGSGGLVVQQRSMSEHNRVDIFIPSGPKDSPAT
ncbi:MAG: hypothetical protein LBK28_02590 [Propionibacteriaceae bacterium]|jgi:hypothetical protein|nr:hypothetical protein [Propionibacteriaceae bacterium]